MAAAPPLAALVRRLTPGSDTVPDAELLLCRRMLAPDRDAAEAKAALGRRAK